MEEFKEYKKGDKIVCINDEFPAWAKATYRDLPEKGKVYVCRDIVPGVVPTETVKDQTGHNPLNFKGFQFASTYLEEIINTVHPVSKQEMGFAAIRFTKLDPVKTEENVKEQIGVDISKPKTMVKPKKRELIETTKHGNY